MWWSRQHGLPPAVALWVGVLTCVTRGLRVIRSPDFQCSQPGVQCSAKDSSCMDVSWLRTYHWTPAAPSAMDVTVGLEWNEEGKNVPVLVIKWTAEEDSSIQDLQGAEVSVLQASINQQVCVQFQYGNKFPSQRNSENQKWSFFYNNFEVEPGQLYHVTVQHLPRQTESRNRKEMSFTVPGCNDRDMGQTAPCCHQGFCWNPSIVMEKFGDDLVVTFDSRNDSWRYLVLVESTMRMPPYNTKQNVNLQPGERGRPVNVSYPGLAKNPLCWYKVQIQPFITACGNDCRRYSYTEPCPTDPALPTSPPEPHKRLHLCSISACVTLLVMGMFIICTILKCNKEEEDATRKPGPDPPPLPTVQKVWLVYSADHKRYVDVVIKLAYFLQTAWGVDVVLDRLHVEDIAVLGKMNWLSRQKSLMERLNGKILLLCSRGTQAKWKAMQATQRAWVTLREDNHELGDLFTPAFSLLLPDLLKPLTCERYMVAYFEELSSEDDVPSPFQWCPLYSLTRNLQALFFRIQGQEQHQPGVTFNVPQDEVTCYQSLKQAVQRCRAWQEKNLDWFERERLPEAGEESASEGEEGFMNQNDIAHRQTPIVHFPKDALVQVRPLINDAESVTVMDPVLVGYGPPSLHVKPLLSGGDFTVQVMHPQILPERSGGVCRQEPDFVEKGVSLINQPVFNLVQGKYVPEKESCPQSDQGYQSESDSPGEVLRAELLKIFQQSGPWMVPELE
ncbi:interleukin-17 receptor A isoform X2 [Ascaphus truei]|uniref:interleukin-17 receptor A isoform X2 n=1 Tax=Ascaphus truei TaxID=8439 RepID=UPI003F5AD4CA